MLTQMGAELVPFSPLHDAQLPAGLDGILLYGGYPELYAAQLEQNCTMRLSIQEVLRSKMPCMAECGGFMYLHEQMEDMDGKTHAMVGMIPGLAYRTPKLSRFGYIMLEQNVRSENEDELGPIPAHEFHYFDSTNCGTAFHAAKPEGKRSWECMHEDGRMMAGFPHLHYYSNPNVPEQFLKRALAYHTEKIQREESTCTM